MKKLSKVLVLLLSVALICTGIIFVASADEAKAETASYVAGGETREGSLADAIAAADAGTTVTLLGDCTISAEIAVTKNVTVDLNGYKLTTECASAFNVTNGEAVFNITGTGNITSAGTLVKATADGAKIAITGTGLDGITIDHTGTVEKNRLISLQSNTFSMNNVSINTSSGALVTASDTNTREYTIANTGTSNITFNKVKVVSTLKNLGYGEKGHFFINVSGGSELTIKDSSFYTHNNFMRLADAVGANVKIADSVISVNDTGTTKGGRLAVALVASGFEATATIDIEDSLVEGSGRMFASDSTVATIDVNAYGTTFKILEAETDLAAKKKDGAYLQFNMNSFNLYNSEAGNSCKIIATSALISRTTAAVFAYEPGLRVNFEIITTATDTASGIKVPKTVEDGTVTEWTYGASAADDTYAWVYDPVGDIDAPFVLVDTTTTQVSVADNFNNTSFDGIRLGVATNKTISAENVGVTLITDNKGENFKEYMQLSIGRGSLVAAYETGNAYIKYVVTPYNDSLYTTTITTTDESGETVTETVNVTAKDIYGDSYDGTTRNFNTEKTKEGEIVTVETTTAADPFLITGKNNDATFISENSFTKNKVLINEFDFGCDSEKGFPAMSIALQCRQNGTDVKDSTYKLAINNAGKITDNTLIYGETDNPLTQLNKNEWYRLSAVCYTDTQEIYVYINGVYMGKANAIKEGVTVDENVYFQGFRINVNKTSTHKVGSSFAMDNISVRSYTDYQYSETSDALNSDTAKNYIIAASPRKYMNDALTVYGMPVANISDAVVLSNELGKNVDINSDINLYDVTENVTVDLGVNNVTVGDGSYGFVKNGEKYTFNENYWYNAYKFTGDLANLTSGSYSDSDFTSVGVIKLGFELDIENYYTERTPNYNNYTVNTQNGWVYAYGDTDSVLPKVPDISDLENADENKNVYYLPLLEAVNMTYVIKDADGNITSYGISNDETNDVFRAPVSGSTLVLLTDFTVSGGSDSYIRIYNDAPIVTIDDVVTVNGVTIDNDYTAAEIATMREVASDFKVDLNGNTLNMGSYRLIIGQNVEFSLYSSMPGAAVNMVYKSGSAMAGARSFNMAYLDGTTKWWETADTMLKNMNSRYNFGTYTDRNGNVVKSEMFSMTGAVIFEAATGDSSCSYNIDNIAASRAATTSNGLLVSRYFDGKMTVKNSIISAFGSDKKTWLIDVRQTADGSFHPDVLFENCIILSDSVAQPAVNNGGPSSDDSVNIVFNNCVSNLRLNSAERNHVYFGEGTTGEFLFVGDHYAAEDLVEAYTWEPMTLGEFVEEGVHFVKIHHPVYDSDTQAINYDNYYYFVDNGYAEEFEAQYPGVQYKELPVLTTKIVKEEDAVKVTFNKLDGTAATEVYYVKGADVQARTSNTSNGFNTVALTGDNATYTANALILTYTGWETLPTDVQADVVVNPTYTAKANIEGLKANLSLYADFNVNLYMPVKYADYAAIYFGEKLINTTSATIGDAEYLAATVSQKCNMAGDDIVFTVAVSETINGKLCEAEASVTLSITKYASAILEGEYTDADKVLMYYMLNYANEAEKYIDNASDEKVTALLDTYSAYGEKYNVDYTYNELCDTASLTDVFEEATLDIESSPAFLFTLKDGFAGTVTITYANGINTRNYEVTAESDRTIALENMKVYNFGTILTITAEGEINGEAVSVSGKYSLDTFADYHANNAVNDASETKEASVACLPLIKSLFAYAEVAELYKTNTLADALVVTE